MTIRRFVTLSAGMFAFGAGAAHAKAKPLHVDVRSLAVNSDACCLTYRIVPASAARLLIDTRDGCAGSGRQWRVTVTLPGRKGAKSNVGTGSCGAFTGFSKMRVKPGNAYKLTLCYDGGASASFPAAVDLRLQYPGGTSMTLDGPAGCDAVPWNTTTTTTTTLAPPMCTTTSTIQQCGGDLGTARIYALQSGNQTLLNTVPHDGTLELTITGTDCHGGSPPCPNGQYMYDYEFWVNDPTPPGSSPRSSGKQILLNGSHQPPVGSPTVADPNNTYLVRIPVHAGDTITALDQDDFSNDNQGYLDVDLNLVCSP